MKMGENWYVNAPWAQLLCSTEIPEDKLVKFMAISNEVLDEAEATEDNFGSGVIPQPWRISFDKFGKYGVIDYVNEKYSDIEADMNCRNSTSKKKQLLATGAIENKKTRKKREELSVSASKSIKKENVEIVVSFD